MGLIRVTLTDSLVKEIFMSRMISDGLKDPVSHSWCQLLHVFHINRLKWHWDIHRVFRQMIRQNHVNWDMVQVFLLS